MITPAYSPTATERVLPRLALDFTTGVLDPRVTITRALNTATHVNSNGYIESVNANLPRFDYNPTTLAAKGLLIEEQRTNNLLYSEAFSEPVWTTNQVTVSVDATAAPSNSVTADKLIPNTNNGAHNIYASFTYAAAAYTLSIFAKAAGYSWLKLGSMFTGNGVYFDVANGVIGTADAGHTATITAAANGFYRCTVTWTASAGGDLPGLYVANANGSNSFAGDGTSGIYVWGAQLEAGSFATSYIPTTTTSLTRNADVVQMTGTNFSSWYNASQGAIYVEGSRFTSLVFSAQVAISDGTTTNEIYICSNTPAYGGTSAFCRISAATGGDTAVGPTAVNTTAKMMLAYGTTNSFVVNGSAGSAIVASQPTVDRMLIGARGNGSNSLNGYVRKIMYYPQRLTDRQIQAISK